MIDIIYKKNNSTLFVFLILVFLLLLFSYKYSSYLYLISVIISNILFYLFDKKNIFYFFFLSIIIITILYLSFFYKIIEPKSPGPSPRDHAFDSEELSNDERLDIACKQPYDKQIIILDNSYNPKIDPIVKDLEIERDKEFMIENYGDPPFDFQTPDAKEKLEKWRIKLAEELKTVKYKINILNEEQNNLVTEKNNKKTEYYDLLQNCIKCYSRYQEDISN